jgi:plastocyanin
MTLRIPGACVLLVLLAGCGSGSSNSNPTAPSPPSATPAATVTIANNAVSPQSVTVARGSRVMFVNNDTRSHEMASNPHPMHTDCPEINQLGVLDPGQSRQTGIFNTARTCGYHDHNQDSVRSLQGTIAIQ